MREEVGVTPWLNPWSWEGYDIIYDHGTPRHALASFFSNIRQFNETQLVRYRPLADEEDKGPIKSRLFDIIDCNYLSCRRLRSLDFDSRQPRADQEKITAFGSPGRGYSGGSS